MKKIVVKIGTSVLTDKDGKLDESLIASLAGQISSILDSKISVLVVSSGAIGAGMSLLNIKKRPHDLAKLQAMAAIGQTHLMNLYNKYFNKKRYLAGQILLTQDDFDNRMRYLNIKYTIHELLDEKIVPIINENDTIATEEIKCGDNDRLSSLVADLIEADSLIILTDVEGLLDTEGALVENVEKITDSIKGLIKKGKTACGTGGMDTKIKAAEFAVESGIDCFIANGKRKDILIDIVGGRAKCTHFKSKASKLSAKKRWIGFGSKVKGSIFVDDGAKTALIEKNRSLLSAGVIDIEGSFQAGDIISISDKQEKEFAKGIINYSSKELSKIKGVKTTDIESILGYKDHDEIVHKDNLVIL